MPKTPKLNQSETDLLLNASLRRHGTVPPLSGNDGVTDSKTRKHIGRLLRAGFIEERPTSSVTNAWRTEESGQHYALRITAAGRTALEATSADGQPEAPQRQSDEVTMSPVEPRGKLGAVLAAVRHSDGAALKELVALTGWQPHTVRASLTRLRQSGFAIQMAITDNGRRYISQAAACEASH